MVGLTVTFTVAFGGGAGAAVPPGCVQAGGVVTCTYTTTGSPSQVTIPAGATTVTILADGAPGGSGSAPGGNGAEATGVFGTSLDAQTLTIKVGQAGFSGSDTANAGQGGWPDGGSGAGLFPAGGGGGSSSVSAGSVLVVAGAGGGAGAGMNGTVGGYGGYAAAIGGDGGSTMYAGGGGGGGAGGGAIPGAGGAAGKVLNTFLCTTGLPGAMGSAGQSPSAGTSAGFGGAGGTTRTSGGGGGGGYAGGGGAGSGAGSGRACSNQIGAGGGGGGGSSFVDPSATSPVILDGYPGAPWTGSTGRVVISYRPAANVVKNGGFEKPVSQVPVRTVAAPKKIGPWQVTAGSVDVVTGSYWPPAAGSQSLDLAGNAPGAIQETLTLPTSGTYKIAFKLAGNPDCGAQTVQIAVVWNGVSVKTFSFDTTGHTDGDLGWVGKSVKVAGAAGAATLGFQNLSAGSCGATLDAITAKQTA